MGIPASHHPTQLELRVCRLETAITLALAELRDVRKADMSDWERRCYEAGVRILSELVP